MIYLFIIILVEVLAIVIAYKRGRHWLTYLIVLHMTIVGVTVNKLYDFGIGVTNLASIVFAPIFTIETLLFRRYGKKATQDAIYLTLFAVGFLLIMRLLVIWAYPIVPVNMETQKAYQLIASTFLSVIVASFLGLYCSMQFLIVILTHLKPYPTIAYFTAYVLAQIVDSIIFFPIVFNTTTYSEQTVYEYTVTGCIVKIIVGSILFPLTLLYREPVNEISS